MKKQIHSFPNMLHHFIKHHFSSHPRQFFLAALVSVWYLITLKLLKSKHGCLEVSIRDRYEVVCCSAASAPCTAPLVSTSLSSNSLKEALVHCFEPPNLFPSLCLSLTYSCLLSHTLSLTQP